MRFLLLLGLWGAAGFLIARVAPTMDLLGVTLSALLASLVPFLVVLALW